MAKITLKMIAKFILILPGTSEARPTPQTYRGPKFGCWTLSQRRHLAAVFQAAYARQTRCLTLAKKHRFLCRADRSLNGASDRPIREIGVGTCSEGKFGVPMFGVWANIRRLDQAGALLLPPEAKPEGGYLYAYKSATFRSELTRIR